MSNTTNISVPAYILKDGELKKDRRLPSKSKKRIVLLNSRITLVN